MYQNTDAKTGIKADLSAGYRVDASPGSKCGVNGVTPSLARRASEARFQRRRWRITLGSMSFDDRLRQAIERGQKRGETRAHEAQKRAMTEEECKRLHSQLRLRLSEQIEACIKRLPNVFPGFQYETIYGDKGWGGACFRDDLRIVGGQRSSNYSRLEMTVRPYS